MIPRLDPGETAGPFRIEIPHEAVVFHHVFRHWPRWRQLVWLRFHVVPPGAWRAALRRGVMDGFPFRRAP